MKFDRGYISPYFINTAKGELIKLCTSYLNGSANFKIMVSYKGCYATYYGSRVLGSFPYQKHGKSLIVFFSFLHFHAQCEQFSVLPLSWPCGTPDNRTECLRRQHWGFYGVYVCH